MRLPRTAHTSRPWRIHAIAPDFDLEDVWALPTPGGPDDLPRLVRQLTVPDRPGQELSVVSRLLFKVRWMLGEAFGWDRPDSGLRSRVPSLRDRLPEDLRDGPRGPDMSGKPFTSVYQTDTEWVSEIANRTVHALMHIGWVGAGADGYHAQMAVLVKPNGRFGRLYMAAILPFRYAFVYPSLLRSIGRGWQMNAEDRPLRPGG
jgi:hypothetical protein